MGGKENNANGIWVIPGESKPELKLPSKEDIEKIRNRYKKK